jgi:hypothetical protein
MEDKIVKIDKIKEPAKIVNIPTKTNYTPFYLLRQPGGDTLVVTDPRGFLRLKRAMLQSQINCNKSVIGGGFNPRTQQEIDQVNNGSI